MQERATKKYRDRNAAMVFARNEIENATAAGFTGIDEYVTTANTSNELSLERSVDGIPSVRNFRRELVLTPHPDNDIKDLVVRIIYADDRNEERKVELETSIFYSVR